MTASSPPPKPFKILLAVLIFGSFAAIIWLAKTPLELYRNKPIPDFALTQLSGKPQMFYDWRNGKPFVVNFFASWCGPCRQELPELAELNKHIPVYGIAIQDSADRVQAMLEKHGNPFTAVALDSSGDMGSHLEIEGLPTTLVLDGFGQVSLVQQGPIAPKEVQTKWLPLVKHLY